MIALEETMNMQWKNNKPKKKRIQNWSFLEKWNTSQTCAPNVGHYLLSSKVVVGHKDTQCYRSEPKMQENQEKTTSEKAQEHQKI